MRNSRTSTRWARSLPTVEAVISLVTDSYELRPTQASLVRSFANDVYKINTSAGSYALKIYGSGRFTVDEVRWEQQFARHLVAAGLPTAADVSLRNGDSVGSLDAPEGRRPFALTAWLPGDKPQPPWTETLYRSVGAALAQLHDAADSFNSRFPRQSVRTGSEPEQVLAVLEDGSGRHELVQRTADAARTELDQLAGQGLRWGLRHGDPSLDNININGSGRVCFYDLDLAGPGWQIEDLVGALSTEFADPFLDGYVGVRPLPAVDLAALPWLRMLATIDNLKFHLIDKPAMFGSASITEGWVDGGFDALARAARDAGLTDSRR
ncbi:MAG TPA: phosphotransferase [Microlunatus sp.]